MDTLYTDGFYRELSPVWLNYVAALKGCWPIRLDRSFTYLELGCGHGRSTTLFAGAFPHGEFVGVDLNPAHVALARRHAEKLGISNVSFLERSFAELSPSDLPECDFIVLHGVYSWVDRAARAEIQRIVREKLKPGGLLYVSYNALPGWAATSPLRKLMAEFSAQSVVEPGNAVAPALAFLEDLAGANFSYLKSNSVIFETVKDLRTREQNYLAHEFMNATWTLFYCVEVADEMSDAKLNFLGSATLPENHIELLVDKVTADKIFAQRSSRLRELLLDYAVNQRFRRDIFVRGHQQLTGTAHAEAFGQIVVGTTLAAEALTPKARIGGVEIAFSEKLFPIVQREIADGPKTIEALRAACGSVAQRPTNVDYLVATLVAAGHLIPFSMPSGPETDTACRSVSQINEAVLEMAIATRTTQQLISPFTGTGIGIDPTEAILVQLQRQASEAGRSLEVRLLESLAVYGLRLSKVGHTNSEADIQAVAAETVQKFQSQTWPALIRHGLQTLCAEP